MIFCNVLRKLRAGNIGKRCMERCGFICSVGRFFLGGEVGEVGGYFEKEIISKTRIMILSHYLNNTKNKILNPKVKGSYCCHREIKSWGWRYFSM